MATRPDSAFRTTDDNVRSFFGIPVSCAGLRDAGARLRSFEPENPRLFVPRTLGIGWDLNLGAVAAKLGLIRPDDSLPDLNEHVPPTLARTLRLAPPAGALLVLSAGVRAARAHDRLPTQWGWNLRPTRWAASPTAVAIPVFLAAAAATWAEYSARTATGTRPEPPVDIPAAAHALGLQALTLLLLRASEERAADPQASRLLPTLGLAAAPAVSTGVLVVTVRGALRRLDRKLRAESSGEGKRR